MLTLWFKNNRQTLISTPEKEKILIVTLLPLIGKIDKVTFLLNCVANQITRCKTYFYIISVGNWLGTSWGSLALSSKFRTEWFHFSSFDRCGEFVMDIYDPRKLEALCASVLNTALSPDPAWTCYKGHPSAGEGGTCILLHIKNECSSSKSKELFCRLKLT